MMTTKVTTILLAPGPSKGIEQGVRKKKYGVCEGIIWKNEEV